MFIGRFVFGFQSRKGGSCDFLKIPSLGILLLEFFFFGYSNTFKGAKTGD